MQIQNHRLRRAYHHVKAAAVVNRIKQVVNEGKHDEGKSVDPPQEDTILGVPQSADNKNETDTLIPTEHNLPADPGFDTDNIIAGTGSGPAMESRGNYNR